MTNTLVLDLSRPRPEAALLEDGYIKYRREFELQPLVSGSAASYDLDLDNMATAAARVHGLRADAVSVILPSPPDIERKRFASDDDAFAAWRGRNLADDLRVRIGPLTQPILATVGEAHTAAMCVQDPHCEGVLRAAVITIGDYVDGGRFTRVRHVGDTGFTNLVESGNLPKLDLDIGRVNDRISRSALEQKFGKLAEEIPPSNEYLHDIMVNTLVDVFEYALGFVWLEHVVLCGDLAWLAKPYLGEIVEDLMQDRPGVRFRPTVSVSELRNVSFYGGAALPQVRLP
jgi:hypothetical protein